MSRTAHGSLAAALLLLVLLTGALGSPPLRAAEGRTPPPAPRPKPSANSTAPGESEASGEPAREAGRVWGTKRELSLRPPTDWETITARMGGMVRLVLASPLTPGDRFRENIAVVVEPLPAQEALGTYQARALADLGQRLAGFRVLENTEATLAGRTARRVVYEARAGGIALRNVAYLLIHRRQGVCLTASLSSATFAEEAPALDRIIQTLRLRDAPPGER